MKLRVGLIGLGDAWESRHRPALRALPDRFEVRAVCCEVAKKAEHVAREFNADTVDGFRAMIAREDVDVVLSLAPDWVGALPILAACEQGKAIYSSAALDIEPEQALEIKKRVEASGVAFMAELPRRHAPATLRLKELIATSLGPPRLLFCHQRLTCEERIERARPGSHCPLAMRDTMELVDWCRYVVGRDPNSVGTVRHENVVGGMSGAYEVLTLVFPPEQANGGELSQSNGQAHHETPSPEPVPHEPPELPLLSETGSLETVPNVDCEHGVVAQISRGHYIPARWADALAYRRPASLQVVCANGIAFIDLPSTLVWFDDAGQHMESLEAERPVGEQLLTHFHRAVTSLIRKTSDLEDAYRALTVVLTANRARREGRRLPLKF